MSDIKRSDRDRKAAVHAANKVHFALRITNVPTPRKRQSSLKQNRSTPNSTLITQVEEDDDVFEQKAICTKSKKDVKNTASKTRPILIWRKWARVVRMMCAVCSALRKYSRSGYIDLESLHVDIPTKRKLGVTQNEDGNLEEVSFNPKDYKKKAEAPIGYRIFKKVLPMNAFRTAFVANGRLVSYFIDYWMPYVEITAKLTWPNYAKRVVEKRPDQRTEDELASIASLMRGLNSFRKYTRRMQYLLCRVVRYCNFNKKRVIVRKGHVGHSFYFIFSGAVSVVFDTDSDSVFVRPEVSILRKGEVFGEIALLKNTTRNASIVCFEDTELLAVDREDFMEHGLYDVMMGELKYRKEFLQSLDLFSTWPPALIEDLCFMSRIEEFRYNKLIVESTKVNEWLYFISKGGCDILRLVDLTKCPEFHKFVPKPLHPTPQNGLKPVILDMETSVEFLRRNTWYTVSTATKAATATKEQEEPPVPTVRITNPQQLRLHLRRTVRNIMMANRTFASADGKTDDENEENADVDQGPPKRKVTVTTPPTDADLVFSQTRSKPQTPTDEIPKMPTLRRPQTSRPRVSLTNADPAPFERVSKLLPPTVRGSAQGRKQPVATEPFMLDQDENDDYVGIGVYVKVDHCIPGNVFGISSLLSHETHFSLVSKGAEVIRVPMSKFIALSDETTKEKVKKLEKFYPTDVELCSKFLRNNVWNLFRQDMVELQRRDLRRRTEADVEVATRRIKNYFKRGTDCKSFERNPMPKISYDTAPTSRPMSSKAPSNRISRPPSGIQRPRSSVSRVGARTPNQFSSGYSRKTVRTRHISI